MYFTDPTNLSFLIGGAVAIIVSTLIFTKDVRAPLNFLFSSSLFLWGISLLFNSLTFAFTTTDTMAVQYIRDISTISGVIGSFLIFITAFTMHKGLHYLKKWYFVLPLVALCIVTTVVGAIYDHVVLDPDFGGVKTTQEPWVMIFIYGIPVILIFLADLYFYLTLRLIDEPKVKTRILLFILGFIFIIFGVLIYAIFGILEQVFSFHNPTIEYFTWIIATLFWVSGPVLQLVGFYIGKRGKETKVEQVEN